MTVQELKFSIQHLLEYTNDAEILQSIYTLLRKLPQEEEDIAGYEVEGEAISEDELLATLLEASRDSKAGNKISMNELKREFGLE
jgi:hypothetical protein